MSPKPSAQTLLDNARQYLAALEILYVVGRNPPLASPSAFYLLVGFAIELALKGLCLKKGKSEDDLRKVGHDLHKAYLMAKDQKAVPHYMTGLGRLVLEMNKQHKELTFRYTPDIPQIEAVDPGWCIERLKELVEWCEKA